MQESEIKKLLSELSIEEKAAELLQLPSSFFAGGNITGPAAELGISEETVKLAGSCLSVIGAEKLIAIQKKHIEEHPHHIPMLFMADIINGYQTVFPIPLAQGCTFDTDLVEEGAAIAAKEAAASGVHVTFSPMADLVRDPRWGRVMESTGESAFLNGKMASAMIYGYQGKDAALNQKGHVAACLKHFAGYGAPEGGRDYNTVELSERTLREDYLPAYQEACDAGCALVMTSFNTINRIPSSANQYLLKTILRGEMGFDGVVISDWQAIAELIPHGIASNEMEAARLSLYAGVDIDMSTSIYVKNIQELISKGQFTEEQLNTIVLRILRLKNKLGLFENPYKDASTADEETLLLCDSHRKSARKCAEESFVLLKNDQVLPLEPNAETIAFIGPFLDNRLISGSWSFFGDDNKTLTVKEALLQNYPNSKTLFADGSSVVDPGVKVIGFQKTPPDEKIKTSEELEVAYREAVKHAEIADKIVLFLGEHREYTGESASKAELTLPKCQQELFDRIYEVNHNIVVVLFSGRPLDIRSMNDRAKAILAVWMPGTEGAGAIVRTLYGDSVPSGKLSMSFPYCVGQIPVYYNHLNTGRPFKGDYKTQRFASKYIDIPNEPLYPFGYGLSYTEFLCSPVQLSTTKLEQEITASVTVTNTGKYAGAEVIQMYIQDKFGSIARPVRELKGFERIELLPGEIKEVTFHITEKLLRFYNANMEYRSEPGEFVVSIGNDSTTQNSAEFTL